MNNFKQWWENTLHIQPSNSAFRPKAFQYYTLELGVFSLEDTKPLVYSVQQTLNQNYDHDDNYTDTVINDENPEETSISSYALLIMAILYGLVVFGGVLGNASLVLTLCSASSIRLRNPLLLAVCLADLLVTGVSAPVTLLNLAINRKTKSLPLFACKLIQYIQVMPVAASTISFFMLSLDRYATVKHPRLAQLRQRRYLHVSLALLSWIASAAISTPFLFAYKIIAKSVIIRSNIHASEYPEHNPVHSPNVSISCTSDIGANTILVSFIIFHTFAVFVIPGLGVLLNHYGVRRKLCALSLTARAAHGELPLPMPILRRQTHMVIVTGIANAQQAAGVGGTDDTSNGGDIQLQNLNPNPVRHVANRNVAKSSNPISPRAMREIRAHSQRQRINNSHECGPGPGPATPGIPLPQTSTLRSRKRLANMLIASALIFIICWTPHVFCIFYKYFGYTQYCSGSSKYFHLLLGYLYSAISPVIYWALNHNSLRQSPCAPIIRLRSMQNFLRTRFRSNVVPPPPSSTNEAALGAFNPRLIKLTPKQYRTQASSHYLY